MRTVVEAGVPLQTLQRVFQTAGQQSLEQAFKSCGVYLVGVQIPAVEVDVARLETQLRATLGAYAHALPAKPAKWLQGLVSAGMTAAQALNFANVAIQNGHPQALAQVPQIPPSALPPTPVDAAAIASALAQRWGAAFTPVHDKFVRDHVEAAMQGQNGGGVRYYQSQQLRHVINAIAAGSGQPMPAGI